jgi:PAS domain S-box-containing protein
MIPQIRSLLNPPIFEDEDKTRVAGLLHVLTLLMGIVLILYITISVLFVRSQQTILLVILIVGVTFTMNLASRRGHVKIAGLILPVAIWLILTYRAFESGQGVYSSSFTGYIAVVLIAGFLLNGGFSLFFATLSSLVGVVLLTTTLGQDLPVYSANDLILRITSHITLFYSAALLLALATRSIHKSLERAQRVEQTLTERNRQLEREIAERKQAETKLHEREESARQFQEQLKLLHDTSIELSTATSLDELYRRAIELGRSRLGFDRMGLWVLNEKTNKVVGTYGTDPQGNLADESDLQFDNTSGSLGRGALYTKGAIEVSEDVDLYHRQAVVGRGWNAVAILWNGHQGIGWLATDNLIQQQPLSAVQLELLHLYSLTLGHLITRMQIQEELRLSEERFSKAFRSNPLAISITRLEDGHYIDVNERWLEWLGYTREEVIGRTARNLNFWEDPDTPLPYIKLLQEQGRLAQMEISGRSKSGTMVYAQIAMEIIDIDGKAHALAMLEDISARKQAEQQRLELALSSERVQLLTEFMGNISHDLKTPLTIMETSLALLERLTDPERQKDKLKVIKEQVLLLNKFIQDILTTSRLDYTPSLVFEPVNLNQLLQTVSDRLHPSAEGKNLTTTLELDFNSPTILADAREIDRMLVNLIENAVNYTPNSGTICIRTQTRPNAVLTEITDTGIGISAPELPHIFERFFRSNTARATDVAGTGLGLAIVKRIVDMHGGSIEVDSTPGQGTTFRVQLPIGQPSSA